MPFMALPELEIRGMKVPVPIFQGGMGVGVSLAPLAGAVAREGGVGLLSSAGLNGIVSVRLGRKVNIYEAIREEVALAKSSGGFVGINIMFALQRDFEPSVRSAIDAGANAIVCGAGLPLSLPGIQSPGETALIPIVSSARALELICRRWERSGRRPDAVVLEGPLAGGHLGFRFDQINLAENRLEKLFPPVKDVACEYGGFPVIVAGGIFTHEDILRFLELGADGVQMGTRFLATTESSANIEYKEAVLACREEDIVVVDPEHNPLGSPCGLPFRIIKQAPMFRDGSRRNPCCNKGVVLQKDANGQYTKCPAKESAQKCFCICNGLLSSAGYAPEELPLWTVGTNAWRVKEILSVRTLMNRLRGIEEE
jgi:nitronate monooxygenase